MKQLLLAIGLLSLVGCVTTPEPTVVDAPVVPIVDSLIVEDVGMVEVDEYDAYVKLCVVIHIESGTDADKEQLRELGYNWDTNDCRYSALENM